MLMQAYSVYDRKALQYFAPFFTSTDGAAIRMLSDLANDLNTNVGRHPSDYVLYNFGNYSDQNGSLEPYSPLRHVIDASALLTTEMRNVGSPASPGVPSTNDNGKNLKG
jgi:hypothetical protein